MGSSALLGGVLVLAMASSVSAQRNLDESAVALGFRNFTHYQKARTKCMELLRENPLVTDKIDCGTDRECYQREAEAIQSRYYILSHSHMWTIYKCDVVWRWEPGRRGHGTGSPGDIYIIDTSRNDKFFIINGEKFSAKTSCSDMEEGDEVLFLEGDASGACASAVVVNLNKKNLCELSCESATPIQVPGRRE